VELTSEKKLQIYGTKIMLNAIYVFGTIGRKRHRLLVRFVPRLLGDVVEYVGRYNIHYLFSALTAISIILQKTQLCYC